MKQIEQTERKSYAVPRMEVTTFDVADAIRTSGQETGLQWNESDWTFENVWG